MKVKSTGYLTSLVMLIVTTGAASAGENDGVIRVESNFDVTATMDRLQSALSNRGMTIFKRVDHAAAAARVGKYLPPTQLLIFGNPKVGTPLMQCSPSVALDLPQKAMVYRDDKDRVWLLYNDPAYLASRHGISGCEEALDNIAGALKNFAAAATR